jgi:mono/diheme cytochrome c family protein
VRGVFNRPVVWAALVAAAVALTAARGEAAGGDVSTGAALFADRCSGCHGRDGSGGGIGLSVLAFLKGAGRPIDFTDPGVMKSWPADRLALVIRDGGLVVGRSTLMPAFGDRLSADEISDLVVFISSLHR